MKKYLFFITIQLLVFAICGCGNEEIENTLTELAPNAPQATTQCPNYLYQNKKDMVLIHQGEFDMFGTEDAPYITVFVESFWIDISEITQGEFDYFVLTTGYEPDQKPYGDFRVANHSRKPAVVSTRDAKTYALWVGKRLPTEPEWEKAARGGLHRKRFSWGDEQPTINEDAYYTHSKRFFPTTKFCEEAAIFVIPLGPNSRYQPFTDSEFVRDVTYPEYRPNRFYQNVMLYEPNRYGLFDMIGGAQEITADPWNQNAPLLIANGIEPLCQERIPVKNGFLTSTKEDCFHVIKGGGFVHSIKESKNENKEKYTIHVGERTYGKWGGFRLVMDGYR